MLARTLVDWLLLYAEHDQEVFFYDERTNRMLPIRPVLGDAVGHLDAMGHVVLVEVPK